MRTTTASLAAAALLVLQVPASAAPAGSVPPIVSKADADGDRTVTRAEFMDHAARSIANADAASAETAERMRATLGLNLSGEISEEQLAAALTRIFVRYRELHSDGDAVLSGWTDLPVEGRHDVVSFMLSRINDRPDAGAKALVYWTTIFDGYQKDGLVRLDDAVVENPRPAGDGRG